MAKFLSRLLFIITACLCVNTSLYAQHKDTVAAPAKDSTRIGFVAKMQAFARQSARNSADEFAADKAILAQNSIFEQIKKTMQKAKIYLKTGVDTVGTRKQYDLIEKDYLTAGDGVLVNKGTAQTFRNLTTTAKILTELLSKATAGKARLDRHQQDLTGFRYQLDSLLSMPSLFKFPTDSLVLSKYLQQILVVAREIHPVDSALKQANINVQGLLNQVNGQVFKLQTSLEEIESYQRGMAKNTFDREFENIWESAGHYRPFSQILTQAKAKAALTLLFYMQDNAGKLVIFLLLFIASYVYIRSLKQIYTEQQLTTPDYEGQLIFRYPLLSAAVIIVNLFQFIFFSPPFILNVIFWTIASVSLTILFKSFITRYWMKVWLVMVSLFLITAFDNLVLQASRSERWFMLIISALGCIAGISIIFKGKKEELREKLILIAIGFMAVLEFGATMANVFGRYNLAKTLLISGYLNVVIGILFLWTIRLINEGLYLAFNVYTHQDPKLFYLNFEKVGKKAPALFYVLLVLGWVILFGRNFAGFEYIAGPLRAFFAAERTIGDYDFSINKLLLFIVIMSIAVIVSKIVSYFASDRRQLADKDTKNTGPGLGSWLLLIRISILSIGLFVAIAAAGIPLDRITIVLGALGVGIGFGLQTLVNNLVSGLIIAFEKPVNVGDFVDIDGQGGTMKSIGFRSSVIATTEGADMVMPNGDLLNSHLINWSSGGNRRRMSIVIGIAYDADLEKTRHLLMDILNAEDRLVKNPAPVVQYEQFSSSSIDVKVFFWTKHLRDSYATRSDLIMTITSQFRKNDIAIPFPQQDVYLHRPE
ncbi:MAG: mechanosensitive ion channel domain-containing protein [Bacteroidota bacterium]